jgi:plasmid stabilization system protein ParE
MTKIVVSQRARDDFKRIWHYIAQDKDYAADRLLMALDAKIARLRSYPEIGSPRDEIRPGARGRIWCCMSTTRPATRSRLSRLRKECGTLAGCSEQVV